MVARSGRAPSRVRRSHPEQACRGGAVTWIIDPPWKEVAPWTRSAPWTIRGPGWPPRLQATPRPTVRRGRPAASRRGQRGAADRGRARRHASSAPPAGAAGPLAGAAADLRRPDALQRSRTGGHRHRAGANSADRQRHRSEPIRVRPAERRGAGGPRPAPAWLPPARRIASSGVSTASSWRTATRSSTISVSDAPMLRQSRAASPSCGTQRRPCAAVAPAGGGPPG